MINIHFECAYCGNENQAEVSSWKKANNINCYSCKEALVVYAEDCETIDESTRELSYEQRYKNIH